MKTTCIIVEDIQIAADFLKKFCEKSGLVEVKGHFLNVPDALVFLDEHKPDLIFLDVEMPGANGFQLLDSLTYSPKIILTTSKTEYAFDAFQYNVNDYLKKPFTYKRFLESIHKVQGLPAPGTGPTPLYVYGITPDVIDLIDVDDIGAMHFYKGGTTQLFFHAFQGAVGYICLAGGYKLDVVAHALHKKYVLFF